uniref:Uncharacterized protein n=1 Tax=Parascaris univalens TaxID=6257 RepID=A0A915A3L6_PARUN
HSDLRLAFSYLISIVYFICLKRLYALCFYLVVYVNVEGYFQPPCWGINTRNLTSMV